MSFVTIISVVSDHVPIIIAGGLQHICEGCVPTSQNKLFSQMTALMFDSQYATHVLPYRIST